MKRTFRVMEEILHYNKYFRDIFQYQFHNGINILQM